MKKVRLFLLVLLLAGCSLGAFDAAGYVKAGLDKIYTGQVRAYSKLVGVDQAAARADHMLDMRDKANGFLRYFGIAEVSGGMMEELCAFCDTLYAKSRYAVGKSRETDENTREVDVAVTPMGLFQQAARDVNQCVNGLRERNQSGEFLRLDEAAYGDICVRALLDVLTPYLDSLSYLPEQRITIRVQRDPSGWRIPEGDLETLDALILDYPKRS